MGLGVFIKSCERDRAWLRYCLKSLEKFWDRPLPKILLALDDGCAIPEELPQKECLIVKPWSDEYSYAMAIKACADLYLPDSDPILLLDSDTVFTGPCGLEDLLEDGKILITYARWGDDHSPTRSSAKQVWVPAIRRALGIELDADFMVRVPTLYWRSTFSEMRGRVEAKHKKPFLEAVRSDFPFTIDRFLSHPFKFCENEALSYCASFQAGYIVRDIRECAHSVPMLQCWSHGPIPTPYLETLLAPGLEPSARPA